MDASLARLVEEIGYEDYGTLARQYEAARILQKTQGSPKAALFQVEGADGRSVGNVVDTREKLYKALRVTSDEDAYKKLLEALESPGELKRVGMPGGYREASRGLLSLPAVKFYERDGGLYLTSSLFIACYRGICNASIHRIMVVGEREGRVRIVPRHLWALYTSARERGERLPVTIVVGVHPAVLLASASTPRLGVFELEAASKLIGGLEVFDSPVHGNPVPVGAAAVVEGWLEPRMEPEGPFADALLLYDKVRRQPVLSVEKVLVNTDEYTHVILGGGLEHAMLMGFPREAQIWAAVSKVVRRVHKVRVTPASGGWLHAVLSVEKNHPGDGKNAIIAAFAAHPSLKHVVVVDPDIDVDDPAMVEWAIATRFQADRDLVVISNVRGSTLDPSGSEGFTSKMGLDATIPDPNRAGDFERARIPGGG